MSTKTLTLATAKAVISHTEDTEYSITAFIGLFAGGVALSSIYTGGKYKRAINASRVFGGYLSGSLKIDPSDWEDLQQTFFKNPEGCAAVIATGGDVLAGLNTLKKKVDAAAADNVAERRANGKAHAAALSSMKRAREAYIKAGLPADVEGLEKEIDLLISLLEEVRANTEKVAA